MTYLLIGLVVGLVAGVPFDFGRERWATKWLVLTLGFAAFGTFVAWLATPQLIGPFWGVGIWTLVAIGLAMNIAWCLIGAYSGYRGTNHSYGPIRAFIAAAILVAIPAIGGLRGCSAFRADDYRALVAENVKERDWQSDLAPVNVDHIRLVSKTQAQWIAKKTLGQSKDSAIGSRFYVGEPTIQKVGNELVWVAPLEFQGFKAWQAADTTPGYVIVSAEDPSRPGELVENRKFRYVPSAYWGDNLKRHLYENGFVFRGTTDYSFELDDEGNPFYVVTVYEPSIGYGGEVVLGVAVVNPETGAIQEYAAENAPAWIDRIIPIDFAKHRLDDYGKYVHGWWNWVWDEQDVNLPTDPKTAQVDPDALWLTWGDDGKAYWFTGLTSSKSTDDSLVGFALMDSRTGHTRIYRLSGSDESGVMEAVNSAVSNFKGWYATQPILYNVYGELTWVVPVVSESGIFQRVAFVRASNTHVSLGENKHVALAKYRQDLMKGDNVERPSSQSDLAHKRGHIDRYACPVVDGNTVCHLTLREDELSRIFAGTSKVSPELVVARPGDEVEIGFLETIEATVPIESFDLLNFSVRSGGQPLAEQPTPAQ